MPINGFPGQVISATAPTVSTAGATGIWGLDEQLQYAGQNLWPGYQISRSVRFRSSASAYFNRTPASASNRQKYTLSFWFKRGTLSTNQALFSASDGTQNNEFLIYLGTGDTLTIQQTVGGSTAGQIGCTTNAVYRDPSSWYHIVLAIDTTQATSTNRLLLYINGVSQTFSSYSVGSSINTWVDNTNAHAIGKRSDASLYFDGYLTEINFIDGQALTPSSFGVTNAATGVWSPIKYTGTYGYNGFYLNFSDNSSNTATTIGKDSSGNGNNWTPNNISVTAGVTYDSMVDVPVGYGGDTGVGGEVRGNYATLNPVAPNPSTTASTCTDGNLTASASAANSMRKATMSITSGKFYFEATIGSGGTVQGFGLGEANVNSYGTNSSTAGARTYYFYNTSNLYTILPGADTNVASTVASNGTLAVAVDMTNKKLWLGYAASGAGSITWVGGGSPASGTTPTYTLTTETELFPLAVTNGPAMYCNFGQRAFTFTAPSGFKALCTQNLATPTIANGASYMAATTYTGTGASQTIANTIGSANFKPDLVWIKSRSAATDHKLTDSVRGATKALISNSTAAETTDTNGLTAFGSTGFTVSTDTVYNNSGATYVGWQWLAGAGSSSSNTSGSITSTVSVNTTAGFSVVTYTGTGANATVGHGLGVAPSMVIIKNRSGANGWTTYHAFQNASPASGYVQLNSTAAFTTFSLVFNNTAPTSSVFSVGTDTSTNASTNNYVAYCFAPIAGYSAFGSYTGNGAADGTFTYLGFRPRFVMFKRTDSTGSWFMEDSSRGTYNVMGPELYAESTAAEATSNRLDFLSNGFKMRATNAGDNASGGTYIYAAFAENPFKYALAR